MFLAKSRLARQSAGWLFQRFGKFLSANALPFNPRSPEFHANPYPVYARLRAKDPVHRSPLGFVLLTRYDDCFAALRDNRFGREGLERLTQSRYGEEAESERLPRPMLFRDPPDHTRLRSLVNKAFTPRVIEGMRAHIQSLVDSLLDRQRGTNSMDIIEDLAYPLPFTVICEMLGIPMETHTAIRGWSGDIARSVDAFSQQRPDLVARGRDARQKIVAYFKTVIAERRLAPRDDLLSLLIAAEEVGDKLSEGEMLATVVLLFVAGHETTVGLIGNGMLALLRHPDQLARLRAEPGLINSAVEEILRYDSPVQRSARLMSEDSTINGHTFEKGSLVILGLGAANRDPAQFSDPERFDITRSDSRPLSFGYGIHFCLGAALARMEAQVAIGSLLKRIPHFALATDRPEWAESSAVRSLKTLPIKW